VPVCHLGAKLLYTLSHDSPTTSPRVSLWTRTSLEIAPTPELVEIYDFEIEIGSAE
jgi:hypothetical protein